MMKERIKNSANGITLIALVITIVVLLILAGVAILAIVSDDGIINKAESAKVNTLKEEIKEKVRLSYLASLNDEGMFDELVFKERIQKNLKGCKVTPNKVNDTYTIEYENNTITINKNGKIIESQLPQKPNDGELYLVPCEDCDGKKYIDWGGPYYGSDSGYYDLYCEIHGFQSEWIGDASLNDCPDCGLVIVDDGICTKCDSVIKKFYTCGWCGLDITDDMYCSDCDDYTMDDYEPADYAVCTLCAEDGKKQYFEGELCWYCDGTGNIEVSCVECKDKKRYSKELCVECKSENIIEYITYEYLYSCDECGNYFYSEESKMNCTWCGKLLNYEERNEIDEYEKCADCGGDIGYYDFICSCVECENCLDEKIIYTMACTECRSEDIIELCENPYYMCSMCGYCPSETEEELEGTECPSCLCGTIEIYGNYRLKCLNCDSYEISMYYRMLCPECGECWTCYDSGINVFCACTNCNGREFEFVAGGYEYFCVGECNYSIIVSEKSTIICPNCDIECHWCEINVETCTQCGSTSNEWREEICPDCQ